MCSIEVKNTVVGIRASKLPFVDAKLLRKVDLALSSGKQYPIKTWSRASTILPNFVGLTFNVHNGRKFISVYVTEGMVGQRLGEFALTRTFYGHGAGRRVKK